MFKAWASEGKTKGTHHATFAGLEAAATKEYCYICSAVFDRMQGGSGDVLFKDNELGRPLEYRFDDPMGSQRFMTLSFHVYPMANAHHFSLLPLHQDPAKVATRSYGKSCRRSPRLRRLAGERKFAEARAEKEKPGYQKTVRQGKEIHFNDICIRSGGGPLSLTPSQSYPKWLPREVPPYTGDVKVAEFAWSSFNKCMRQHRQCERHRDPSWYPARLLDVTGLPPRLVLCDLEPPEGAYATLSHCWGKNPTFLTLTADNLDSLCKEIPADTLPKSFREAVEVTKWLQIRYLWIDSLCILQSGEGSKEDWAKHVVAMRSVYKNGAVNVAVARSENANGGCFASRNPSLVQPCIIDWLKDDGSSSDPPRSVLSHVLLDEYLVHTGLQGLPLASRAWVVQERLLSPRVLHFGSKQIFWECAEVPIACETFPRGIEEPALASDRAIFNVPASLRRKKIKNPRTKRTSITFQESWLQILRNYTRCALTRPAEDKFAAIAGIAEAMSPLFKSEYVAGFFRSQLPASLLWIRQGERDGKKGIPKRALDRCRYRAPTWSWASMDVQLVFPVFPDHSTSLLATVVDIRIGLANPQNSFGPLRSAELTLRGFAAPVEWDRNLDTPYKDDTGYSLSSDPSGDHLALSPHCCSFDEFELDSDYSEATTENLDQAVVFCILSDEYAVRGLVLRRSADGGPSYTRLGTCRLEAEGDVSDIVQWFRGKGEVHLSLI